MRDLPQRVPWLRSKGRNRTAEPEPEHEQFRTGLRRHAALIYLSKKAARQPSSSRLLADACRITARAMNADHVHVLELLPDGRTLIARAAAGWSPDWLTRWRMDVAPSSRLGRVLRSGGVIPLASALNDVVDAAGEELLGATRMQCGLAIGIVPDGLAGALFGVYFGTARGFSPDEVQFVRTVALLVESALMNEAQITLSRLAKAQHAASEAELLRLIVSRLRPALRQSVGQLRNFQAAPDDSFTFRRSVKMADRHVAEVADFLEDLSLLADVLEGRIDSRDRFSVGSIVSDLADQLCSRAAAAGIELRIQAGADFVVTRGNAALIRRALINLLDNALRFTAPEGRVTIKIMTPDVSTGIIEIADTGRGMSRAQLDRLSADHHGLDGSKGHGPGIGWRLASAIIDAHGGTLSATSAGPDCGTTVAIRLARQPGGRL